MDLPDPEGQGAADPRVVYLAERALEVMQRLSRSHKAGPVFRSTDGRPWCFSRVKCRFQNRRVTLGRMKSEGTGLVPPKHPRLKVTQRGDARLRAEQERRVKERRRKIAALAREHGPRFTLDAFWHSFIAEALVRGVDASTVWVLAGHRDTTMIPRHYAHVTDKG